MLMLHILPGDSLFSQFPVALPGERLICRECLLVGEVQGETLEQFWRTRAQFIQSEYGDGNYHAHVVSEFEKLKRYPVDTEINLWFEYEVFCQVNLWFVLYLLQTLGLHKLYRVCPMTKQSDELWQGFSVLNSQELEQCFTQRLKLSALDIQHGANLWRAYQKADYHKLQQLSCYQSAAFPMLQAVCAAEIARQQQHAVENILQAIIAGGAQDFAEVFSAFQAQAGIYGLGDLQLKRLYTQLISDDQPK